MRKLIIIAILLVSTICCKSQSNQHYWEPTNITFNSVVVTSDTATYWWITVGFNVIDTFSNYLSRLTPPQPQPMTVQTHGFLIQAYNIPANIVLMNVEDSAFIWTQKNYQQ